MCIKESWQASLRKVGAIIRGQLMELSFRTGYEQGIDQSDSPRWVMFSGVIGPVCLSRILEVRESSRSRAASDPARDLRNIQCACPCVYFRGKDAICVYVNGTLIHL